MLTQILTFLAILAVPCAAIAIIDDWFLRPHRRLAAPPATAPPDPPVLAAIYYALPVLLCVGVVRLLESERLDFSLVLVLIVAAAALVWLLDRLVLAPRRAQAAQAVGRDLATVALPVTVDYARSFLPVVLVVLLVRSFVFEPFRIPSDSMMPTLLDGDFIIVNKYDYGLRLPVINTRILKVGEPQRGDVVVFRYPPNPTVDYIKRLVGLPGDTVRVTSDQLFINGKAVPFRSDGRYDDGCYHNMRLSTEVIGSHTHQVLSCLTPDRGLSAPPSATCNRGPSHDYQCVEPAQMTLPDSGDTDDIHVPPGEYLMIGDNRDNSEDGRYWGFVPEANLIGKATRIWFNWDLTRSGGPMWSRIGKRIE